jgi:hypothetical protein
MGDQSCEYEAEADDEPRQRIEVLVAARLLPKPRTRCT